MLFLRRRMKSKQPDLEYLFPALQDYGDGKPSTNSITNMGR